MWPTDDTTATSFAAQVSETEQAEVRLVVKFIVEEQIYFKGRILERTPLESEEISRIVSKIALSETQLAGYKKSSTSFKAEVTKVNTNSAPVPTVEITKTISTTSQDILTPADSFSCRDLSSQKEEISSMSNKQPPSPSINSSNNKELSDKEETIMTTQGKTDMESSNDECMREETCLDLVAPERLSTYDNCDTLSKIEIASDSPETSSIHSHEPEMLEGNDLESTKHTKARSEAETKNELKQTSEGSFQLSECTTSLESSRSLLNKEITEAIDRERSHSPESNARDSIAQCDSLAEGIDNTEINCAESPTMQDKSYSQPTNERMNLAHYSDKKKSIKRNPTTKSERSMSTSTSPENCNHKQQSTLTKRLRQGICKTANRSLHEPAEVIMSNQTSSLSSNTPISDTILLNSQTTRRLNNTKVFAKWTDLHFYPGTVQKPTGDKKYIVNFCDGGTKALAVVDMIPVINVNKKNVRVAISKNLCVNAIVHGQHSQNQNNLMFDVEYNQGGNLIRRHVPFKDIFLTFEQGSPLVDQPDRVPGGSNFADVDLDNIIFEKRPRRFQEMDNYLPEKVPGKRRRRHLSHSPTTRSSSLEPETQSDEKHQITPNDQSEISDSKMDVDKKHRDINVASPSNTASNSSNSSSSSNVPPFELRHEIYFSGPTHRTKTSLLL